MGASLKSTLIAVALAGALALGACGSDPKPNTATESPATANSPTVAPVMPDLARENTDAGAEAFVRHYIDTLNYARSSGALEPIEALSDPECINCNVTFDTMRGVFGRGGKYEGGASDQSKQSVKLGLPSSLSTHSSKRRLSIRPQKARLEPNLSKTSKSSFKSVSPTRNGSPTHSVQISRPHDFYDNVQFGFWMCTVVF